MARVLTEGFESGTLAFWDTPGAAVLTTDSPVAYAGTYCCIIPTYSDGLCVKNLPSALTELYYRQRMHHKGRYDYLDNGEIVGFIGSNGVKPIILKFNNINDHHFYSVHIYEEWGATLAVGTWEPPLSEWYTLEVYVKLDETVGRVITRINGNPIPDIDYTGNTVNGISTDIKGFREHCNNWTSHYAIDDVALNDTTGPADNSWIGVSDAPSPVIVNLDAGSIVASGPQLSIIPAPAIIALRAGLVHASGPKPTVSVGTPPPAVEAGGTGNWRTVIPIGLRGIGIGLSAGAPGASTVTPWYLESGIALSDFVALWQPEGAASLAASYVDKITGVYPALPQIVPTLVAAGWVGNDSAYLRTGITHAILPADPANYCMGVKIVVANGAIGNAIGRGSTPDAAWWIGAASAGVPADIAAYGLGQPVNGIVLNGCRLYVNGVLISQMVHGSGDLGELGLLCNIDPVNGESNKLNHATLGATFIISKTVTASQAAALSTRMLTDL